MAKPVIEYAVQTSDGKITVALTGTSHEDAASLAAITPTERDPVIVRRLVLASDWEPVRYARHLVDVSDWHCAEDSVYDREHP